MKFAVAGDDLAVQPWLLAWKECGATLLAATLVGPSLTDVIDPTVRRITWEQLLVDRHIDAVLIAGETEEIQAAAKQLAAENRPLLILPQLSFGVATAYELSLIRDDSGVVLMPAFAHRSDAELRSLARQLRSGVCGTVRRLQIDVELPAANRDQVALTESEIESVALLDVDLLRWLGGNYDQVTSQRSGQSDQGCSLATIMLAGSSLPDATWTIRRGPRRISRLQIETDQTTITISRDASFETESGITALVRDFQRACQGEAIDLNWSDAVRAFDILDAARRSLRRRRTIDVQFETLSERQQFKTQMTAIGCGLLLLTLLLMFGLLGIGAMFDADDRRLRDAQAIGLVVSTADFEAGSKELRPASRSRLDQISERLRTDLATVYLQPEQEPPNHELDQQRREELVRQLTNQGIAAANHRTQIAPIQRKGWETIRRILRIAWIIPLLIFLALQFLLFVARPAKE